jgi:hypothetical protein
MVHRFGANRLKSFCFKTFSWVLVVSTYVEIFLRREHLNRLINVNLLYCGKSSYKGFIFMTHHCQRSFGDFFPLGDQKQNSETHTKYFVKRICQSCQILRIFFCFKSPYLDNRFQQVPKIYLGFLNSFTMLSDLYPNLCNFSCA